MRKMEEIMMVLIQNNAIVAAHMELEAVSYPVPGKIKDCIVERFFLFSNQPTTIKCRPYAWFSIDSETGKLLQYCNCKVQDFAEELNTSLTQKIDYGAPMKGNNKELMAAKREFTSLYAQIREFVFLPSLEDVQKKILSRYKELQDQLISSEALSYYQLLSKEFYAWMTKTLS